MLTDDEVLHEVIDGPRGSFVPRPDTQLRERPGWYQLVTPSARGGYLNEVYLPVLEPDAADLAIDEVLHEYRALGISMKWVLGPGTRPADLGERLARRGLRHWTARGMALVIDDGTLPALQAPPEIRVVEAHDDDAIAAYSHVIARGWDMDMDVGQVLDACRGALAQSPRRHRFFVAYAGDEAAGAAGFVERPRSAYLYSGVVLPEHRGRGLYRALVAARARAIAASGRSLAVTHARQETSAPILEGLGFQTACTFHLFGA